MSLVFKFSNIDDYNSFNNHDTLHPLVNVIDFSKALPREWNGNKKVRLHFGFYCALLKQVKCGDLKYGKNYYDYQEGTLIFISPGQIVDVETDGKTYQPLGHALCFHPDLLFGSPLNEGIHKYRFFEYQINEALHISKAEKQTVLDCFNKIQMELDKGVDNHSSTIINANIDLFLSYCNRFYDRQYITREKANSGILENFEILLKNYFTSDAPIKHGLPTVTYFAEQLHLSPNYFGDLIKKQTGSSAKFHIQEYIIQLAKAKTYNTEKSVSEIAYELGFKYTQHFSRLFKEKVGHTPLEFRALN